MALVRGYTDEIKMLIVDALLGAPAGELLKDTLARIGKHSNMPLRISATYPTADAFLNIDPNVVESGDLAGKATPPVDDIIGSFVASTINFQTGATSGGTIKMSDGSTFVLPTGTLNYYRRVCLVFSGSTLYVKFSPEAATLVAVENPGTTFSSMDGLPVGYVNLQCTNATGMYKTADSTTDIIENKANSVQAIFRFGAGGGAGGGTIKDFKLQSISGTDLTVKAGGMELADGREIYAAADLVVSLAGYTVDGDYYAYIDLYSLPTATTVSGRELIAVAATNIVMSTTVPRLIDLNRYVPLGMVQRTAGVWGAPKTIYLKQHAQPIATSSALEYTLPSTQIGEVGGYKQSLAVAKFPSTPYGAGQIAWYNLESLTDGYGSHLLSNNGAAPFTGAGILDVVNTCLSLNGTTQYLSSTESHFDPGDTDWTCGGWYKPNTWNEGAYRSLFSQWASTLGNYRSFSIFIYNGSLSIAASIDGISGTVPVTYSIAGLTGWNHIAIKYAASTNTFTLYINGFSVSSGSLAGNLFTAGTRAFNIGSLSNSQQFFAGLIDEFFFCNGYAFTDNELSALVYGPPAQLRAGHVLAQGSFPAAAYANTSFFNLSSVSTVNDGNTALGHNLANTTSVLFDRSGIIGVDDACPSFNGTSQYLSSTDAHFDPGDNDFTCGIWANLPVWTGLTQGPIMSQWNSTSAKRSFLLHYETALDLILRVSTDGTANTYVQIPVAGFTGWHHFTLRYTASTNTFDVFVDGLYSVSLTLPAGLMTAGDTFRKFNLGSFNNGTNYLACALDEFFFTNGYAYTNDEIAKIVAAKISHNRSLAANQQRWLIDVTTAGQARSVQDDVIVDKDVNDLYYDLSAFPASASVEMKLEAVGGSSSATAVRSRVLEGTAADVDTLIGTGRSFGFTSPITSCTLQVETSTPGIYEPHEGIGAYFNFEHVAPYRLMPAANTLTAVLGASTKVRVTVGTGSESFVVSQTIWNTAIVTASRSLLNNDEILGNSSAGSFTLTLPGTPRAGWRVRFKDAVGSCVTYPVTIARNGNTIGGATSDLVIDVANSTTELVYDGVSDWEIIPQSYMSSSGGGGGGGLTVTALTSAAINGTSLLTGKNYLIDFSAAAAHAGATLPTGTAGASLQISPFGNKTNSYRQTVTASGGQQIYYDGSLWDALTIQPSDWAIFLYWDDSTPTTRWVAVDYPTQDASIVQASDYNLCLNPNDALLTWAAAATGSVTTDTSTVPLGPVVQTSVKVSGSAANDYGHYRFTMPEALKNRKLTVEWWQIAATLTSGDFKCDLYTNTAADYSGTATRVALSTDVSAASPIPNANGQYRTSWDADSSSYYELRIVRTGSGAKSIYLAGVMIGMRNVLQGAAVSEWVSYTPTWTNVTMTGVSGFWRRVGDSMEIMLDGNYSAGTTAAAITASIPTGFNIDSTKLVSSLGNLNTIVGNGIWYDDSAGTERSLAVTTDSATTLKFRVTDNTTVRDLYGNEIATSDQLGARCLIAISEWAGSGTVNVVQNDVEYVSNSNATNTAVDTTSFAYGTSGSLVPNGAVGTEYVRRVSFQTPISPTDRLVLETDMGTSGAYWFETSLSGTDHVIQGASAYGLRATFSTITTADVVFAAQGRKPSNATYAGNGAPWSDLAAHRWRVRKVSGGQAIGFGMASATSAGLIPAYVPPTTPAFNAGDYTSTGGGTAWTVDSGDIVANSYSIIGKMLFMNVLIQTSTITGTPSQLLMKVPEGKTIKTGSNNISTAVVSNNGGANAAVLLQAAGGATLIVIYPNLAGTGTFAAGTNNNQIMFSFSFPIN